MDARVACHKSATATGQHRATWCGTARHGMAWHSYNVQRSTAAFDMCSTFSPVLFTGFAFVLQPAYCCIFVGCQLQCPLLLLTPHTVRMPFIGFFRTRFNWIYRLPFAQVHSTPFPPPALLGPLSFTWNNATALLLWQPHAAQRQISSRALTLNRWTIQLEFHFQLEYIRYVIYRPTESLNEVSWNNCN